MTRRPGPARLVALALGTVMTLGAGRADAQPAGPRPDYRGTGVVEARGLRPGDRITFGLLDTPDALLVIAVERRR